jgi:hypothetical protein
MSKRPQVKEGWYDGDGSIISGYRLGILMLFWDGFLGRCFMWGMGFSPKNTVAESVFEKTLNSLMRKNPLI